MDLAVYPAVGEETLAWKEGANEACHLAQAAGMFADNIINLMIAGDDDGGGGSGGGGRR